MELPTKEGLLVPRTKPSSLLHTKPEGRKLAGKSPTLQSADIPRLRWWFTRPVPKIWRPGERIPNEDPIIKIYRLPKVKAHTLLLNNIFSTILRTTISMFFFTILRSTMGILHPSQK
jgi:hypothetical protein